MYHPPLGQIAPRSSWLQRRLPVLRWQAAVPAQTQSLVPPLIPGGGERLEHQALWVQQLPVAQQPLP